MKAVPTSIPDVVIVEPRKFEDPRGFFLERFRDDFFRRSVAPFSFVQDNFSRSKPGVIRGLHFQTEPWQGKLVSVTRGRIWDVAVDLRPQSETYRKWVGAELTEENQKMLWVPPGFAHGFCVLGEEPADVFYKVTEYFSPGSDGGIRYDDPSLNIPWPIGTRAILSDKDRKLPLLDCPEVLSLLEESAPVPCR